MAGVVISSFLSLAIEKLASAALEKLAHFMGIHSNLQNMKASLSHIEDLLDDASKKEITNESVKRWLNRLQHLAYDIEDVLDDLQTESALRDLTEKSEARPNKVRKLISNSFPTLSLSVGMKEKLVDVTSRLQDLEKEMDTFGLIVKHGKLINVNRRYETSLPDAFHIVGREDDKEKLMYKLLGDEVCDENFSIVPIVGIGGVGKTALARLVYNEPKVNDHFELKAWVCVSNEFDIFHISKVIFQSVTGQNKEFKDLNLVQEDLRKQVMGKRFLLVLDDVWCECRDDWDCLVKPFYEGARGSKIIITTRKEQLLNELRHKHRNHLGILSSDDALSLFAIHAFGVDNFDSHPTLKPYGEHVVNKCGRLPLALKALGRLLGTKVDEEEWKEVLNSEIWKVGKGDEILPALRLSYLDLSVCLKRLFAYCSLFPKAYLFDKEELVLLWMAEGFLPSSIKLTKQWGRECFDELLSRSFFQRAPNEKSLYMMHDLMNDLAMSVAGDFFSRLDIGMKKEFIKDALEKYRHMSFVCEEYNVNEKFKVFKEAKNLRSFLALSSEVKHSQKIFYISYTILADLLHELPLLRVLSLSYLSIRELPESIGRLKLLRYLNLSQTRITHLPENVCNLYNLQTLIVSGCYALTELPNNFLKLKNLLHFDIRNTMLLNKMPVGIGKLKRLRILASMIIIGGDYVFAANELKELTDLEGELSIEGLEKVQNQKYAHEVNLSQKRISELELRWNHVFNFSRMELVEKEVLNVLKPRNDSLKKLNIRYYGGTEFPNWVGDPLFSQLVDVSIGGCKKCTSLPQLGQLPSLKKLFIESMDGVKSVGLELLGTTGPAFPSLKSLNFINMKGLEVWLTNTHIPFLEELRIEGCPKLVIVSVEALPSLRVLEVVRCGDGVLRSLVHVASSSLTRLNIRDISGLTDEVWRGVMEHLRAVEQLSVYGCSEIRYLWESEAQASKALVKLIQLFIERCLNLVKLGEKEENSNNFLTSLRTLNVWYCPRLERCRCPNNIETLWISGCDSITSVSFPTKGGGQKLKSLSIMNCKKHVLEKDMLTEEGMNMPLLESILMHGVENLESIIGLRNFIHLTSLEIADCPKMKSFPDHELQNLSMLKHMVIRDCPMMDASFPRGLWPPNLHSLEIGGLKKPISKWGPQTFPTSLVDLTLYGGSLTEEGVSSWSELMSDLLPLSLIKLEINRFEKWESLSLGLQHLTSLQHLEILYCPRMKDLPETMVLSSLLSLRIRGCPILKERCSKSGSYWPLISHIPKISNICVPLSISQLAFATTLILPTCKQ